MTTISQYESRKTSRLIRYRLEISNKLRDFIEYLKIILGATSLDVFERQRLDRALENLTYTKRKMDGEF